MESLRYFAPLDPMNEYFPPNRFPKFAVALIAVGAISIVDTGLRSRSVTEDVEVVLRKIEYWPQGSYISVCHAGSNIQAYDLEQILR